MSGSPSSPALVGGPVTLLVTFLVAACLSLPPINDQTFTIRDLIFGVAMAAAAVAALIYPGLLSRPGPAKALGWTQLMSVWLVGQVLGSAFSDGTVHPGALVLLMLPVPALHLALLRAKRLKRANESKRLEGTGDATDRKEQTDEQSERAE